MADTPSGTVPVEPEYTAAEYLRLIAEGWEVIESTGSQMTIQNPEDDGPQDLVIDVDLLSAAPAPEGGAVIPADEMTESALKNRAIALLKLKGWKAGDRIHMHGVIGLMTEFGMDVTNRPEEDRCGHPDCGCDFDQVCDAALATREEAPAEAGDAFLSWLEREIDEASLDIGASHQEGGTATEREKARPSILSDVRAEYLALRAQPPARAWGWDYEICTGCSASLNLSCCPDRRMVTVRDLVDAYDAQRKPPAREDAQPIGHFQYNATWSAWEEVSPEYAGSDGVVPLYRHPAPDALRVAMEAIIEQVKTGASGTTVQALGALSDIEQIALAALQAEQKGGAA